MPFHFAICFVVAVAVAAVDVVVAVVVVGIATFALFAKCAFIKLCFSCCYFVWLLAVGCWLFFLFISFVGLPLPFVHLHTSVATRLLLLVIANR